jgi:cytochrome oxidase assembly protein ShyY1
VLLAPRLLPLHLLGIAATVAAVMLGLWQVEAWQAQREAAARDLSTLEPVPLDEVLDPDAAFPSSAVGRPVELSGSWLPGSTFYVTDRDLDGRTGLWAVTPVAVCDDPAGCAQSSALLVVRGWTDDPADAPAPPEGEVALTGWLQPPEGSGRPDPDPSDDRLPEVRIADAIQRVDQDLYGAYLIADEVDPGDAGQGLEPVTPDSLPDPDSSTGLRNLLYGIQWFLFAGFAVYVWWRWGRDELERSRASERALAEPEPEDAEVPSEP